MLLGALEERLLRDSNVKNNFLWRWGGTGPYRVITFIFAVQGHGTWAKTHRGQAQAGRRLWVRPGSLEKFGGNRERVNVAGANLRRTWNPKPGVGTLIHISPSCLRNQLSPSEAGCSSSRRWVWDHWWSLQWNTPVGTRRTALTQALL